MYSHIFQFTIYRNTELNFSDIAAFQTNIKPENNIFHFQMTTCALTRVSISWEDNR